MASNNGGLIFNMQTIIEMSIESNFQENISPYDSNPMPHDIQFIDSESHYDFKTYLLRSYKYNTRGLKLNVKIQVGTFMNKIGTMAAIKVIPIIKATSASTQHMLPANNGGFKNVYIPHEDLKKGMFLASKQLSRQIRNNPYFKP